MNIPGGWNFGICKVTHVKEKVVTNFLTEEITCTESESCQEFNFVLEFKLSPNGYISQ